MSSAWDTIRIESKDGYVCELNCEELRANSDYFRALLDSGMREAQLGVVTLPTVNTQALQVYHLQTVIIVHNLQRLNAMFFFFAYCDGIALTLEGIVRHVFYIYRL